ncbi:hypothetical protein VNI00_000684 [Paramarasmius palmivorus]|uniref:Uncharacterized protein n=1 Tax=Paramarasmius palmivorus TaxID=297713 RepID=A0AAW0EA67_9AGAR
MHLAHRYELSPSIVLLLITFLSTAQALLQTRFIDDETGDPITGKKVTYSPANQWSQGNTCTGCNVRPSNTSAYNGTWHDTTHFMGDTPRSVQFLFTGVSLSVFCILPPKSAQAIKTYDLTFTLDGASAGSFSLEPDSDEYQYNVAVVSLNNLTQKEHSFMMQAASSTIDSLILFDYATYVFDDSISTSASLSGDISPTSTPSNTASAAPSRSSSKSDPTAAIVGGVLGGLLVVALAGLALILAMRRRRKSKRSEEIVEPFSYPIPHQQHHRGSPSVSPSDVMSYNKSGQTILNSSMPNLTGLGTSVTNPSSVSPSVVPSSTASRPPAQGSSTMSETIPSQTYAEKGPPPAYELHEQR